ncbi:WD40 repeat-like protein [Piedraia hortae CBS 480.64]|uniref:Peroxin-7 n=1 Tax=Piedraia hortae CBS 480.64 TaxID=1314780 RepID=A0A6A7C429_9PEZI|nr:WD40 repeat-like protein [Piedraia hortae CBS 480.64]
MLEFRTAGINPYNVKYSPFFDNRLAVGGGANYGIVGNGRLYILSLTPKGVVCDRIFETQDCLFDIAWSEQHENQVLTAGGDGKIKLFDFGVPDFPVAAWQAHGREIFAVDWNMVQKDCFLSCSWDGMTKAWSPERQDPIITLPVHSCVYSAEFSPHHANIVTCVSQDSHLRVFDLRTKDLLTLAIPIHGRPVSAGALSGVEPSECLTHDWNKYNDSIIGTGSVDGKVRVFDLRQPAGPLRVMAGHEYAVRRVSWSPHLSDTLLSASYDMSCRIWNDGSNGMHPAREVGRMDRHTEFAMGTDWCLFGAEGWCATCAWDERVLIWDVREFMK